MLQKVIFDKYILSEKLTSYVYILCIMLVCNNNNNNNLHY